MTSAADGYSMALGGVFTLFFLMLGPLKLLGPFAVMTRDEDESTARRIALLAFVLATVASVAGGFVGVWLARKWNVSSESLLLAGGLVFFLVGLRLVLEQYEGPSAPPAPLPKATLAAAFRITFPTIITPYGIAALIVLLSTSRDSSRTLGVLGVLVGVMVVNLLAMLFARRIMAGSARLVLQVLGAILGVIQVGLALEIILGALARLGVLDG